MNWKKIWTWVMVIFIISALVFFIRKGWKASKKCSQFKDSSCLRPDFTSISNYDDNDCLHISKDIDLQLEKGMHGCEVLELQYKLNEQLRSKCGNQLVPIDEDGKFGCETLGALQSLKNISNTTLNNI